MDAKVSSICKQIIDGYISCMRLGALYRSVAVGAWFGAPTEWDDDWRCFMGDGAASLVPEIVQ